MSKNQTDQRPETAYIVFSTHWDREWIQPFEQYRFRLVNLIDALLDTLRKEPEIRFFFDGQTVFLVDYLEIRPENKAALQAFAHAGRLVVGPWYVLADQFLESAEATVRNLLIGRQIAAEFGGAAAVGYVPDSFGSIASLPALLNGFGISLANFGRGRANLAGCSDSLFWWQWKDGSRVLALNRGYGNAISLSYPNIWGDIEHIRPTPDTARSAAAAILDTERQSSPIPLYYLSAGIDHLPMPAGMTEIVAALNAGQTRTQFVVSDSQRYLQDARSWVAQKDVSLAVAEGEMRGDAALPMDLQGVLSTNQEVKRANRRCEVVLTGIVEPLSVIARSVQGTALEHHVAHAWKTLLKNHPHDSICACSIDSVIADVLARFRHVRELTEILGGRTLRSLVSPQEAADLDAPCLTLYNPTAERHVSGFEMCVRMPAILASGRYNLVNDNDVVVGTAHRRAVKKIDLESIFATNAKLAIMLSKDSSLESRPLESYTLLDASGVNDFGAAIGFQTLRLVPEGENAPLPDTGLTADDRSVSNALIRLAANADGTVSLTDLVRGTTYSNLGGFEDTADLGDTYDYGPLGGDTPVVTRGKAAVSVVTRRISALVAEMEITLEMPIPEDSQPGGRGQSRPHKIVTVYRVLAGSSCVLARTQFVNASVHHRLRVVFPFQGASRPLTGGHFAAMERDWTASTERFPCRPFTDYIHLTRGESQPPAGDFGLWTRGIYECELQSADANQNQGTERRVYLTLCRSTTSVGPAAGANYPVSHAQELGPVTAEYAFGPSASLAGTIHQAAAYVCPVIGEAHFASRTGAAPLGDILSVSPAEVVLTCLKRAMDNSGTILRLFNPHSTEQSVSLVYSLPFSTARRVDLSETDLPVNGSIAHEESTLRFTVGPYEIVTVRVVD